MKNPRTQESRQSTKSTRYSDSNALDQPWRSLGVSYIPNAGKNEYTLSAGRKVWVFFRRAAGAKHTKLIGRSPIHLCTMGYAEIGVCRKLSQCAQQIGMGTGCGTGGLFNNFAKSDPFNELSGPSPVSGPAARVPNPASSGRP
jgi:hypothetical protein